MKDLTAKYNDHIISNFALGFNPSKSICIFMVVFNIVIIGQT